VSSLDTEPPSASEQISVEEVIHVAKLARLQLSEEEVKTFTDQLASVLRYASQVAALDTATVEPTAHPMAMVNVFREDLPRPGLNREEVLDQAPAVEGAFFKVPRIVGEE
jgi:aspartyl-tRNA(Asn)/glutamyl-tRNA(Gln) amidotransferase subunit C